MKAYTDIEQSIKLKEILSIESADMYWLNRHIDLTETKYEIFIVDKSNKYVDFFKSYAVAVDNNEIIPCWSLAALLKVLPSGKILVNDKRINTYKVICKNIDSDIFENPVDACIDMIYKLKKMEDKE